MTNSDDKIEILKEMAVFNYVAGSLSEPAKRNFESMLEQDPALQQAVEIERALRVNMQKAGELEPVAKTNFDALLSTIEVNETESNVSNIDSFQKASEARTRHRSFWNPAQFAVAASLAVFSIMSVSLFLDTSEPKFNTLSDGPASEQVDFVTLSTEGRIAKITFSEGLSASKADEFLREHDLTIFEAGAGPGQQYVVSGSALTNALLDVWRSDARIQQVEVFAKVQEK